MAPPRQARARWIALAALVAVLCGVAALWWGAGRPSDPHPSPPPGTPEARDPHVRRFSGVARPEIAHAQPASGTEVAEEPVARWGDIVVRVVDVAGRPEPGGWAEALDCPWFRPANSPRALAPLELSYAAAEGRCVLVGVRRDGLVRTEGPPVTVEVRHDDVARVDLVLPVARTGGVMLALEPVERGARLAWVPADSPLAQAGLMTGDVVLSIDGIPLTEVESEEIVGLVNGPVGTTFLVEVERAGADTGQPVIVIEVERHFLEG